jgi:catechol 2,3-dioxygenase
MSQLPHIASVRIRVHHLDELRRFYEEVVGLQSRPPSPNAVALGASSEAPPIVLLEEDADAPRRSRATAGLFHLAIRLPTRRALSEALRRIEDDGYPLSGASDHVVSEALYLRDPEGNGIEIYRDRPTGDWPTDSEGQVRMDSLALDLDDLRAETNELAPGVPSETDLGHVHLEVTDLECFSHFGRNILGMNIRAQQPGAVFLAWGDYHHHVAANTWRQRSHPGPPDALGLVAISAQMGSQAATEALVNRAHDEEGVEVERGDRLVTIVGPDGIRWELTHG